MKDIVSLLTVVVADINLKSSYKETASGLWDFTDAVGDDYVPVFVYDVYADRILFDGVTCEDLINEHYNAFIEGLVYAGVTVHENYGIWFTTDPNFKTTSQVREAINNNEVEQAE